MNEHLHPHSCIKTIDKQKLTEKHWRGEESDQEVRLQSRLKVHFPTIQNIYSDCFIIVPHQIARNKCSAHGGEQ